MLKKDELHQLISDTLAYATKLGANAAEVSVSGSEGFTVEVRLGKVETIEQSCDRGLTVTVYFGQHAGTASTTDFAKEALHLTVEKACYIARYTEEDPALGLADVNLMAHNYPDLDLAHSWKITVAQASDLAKECEAQGLTYDKRITNSDGVQISTAANLIGYGNTHGFIGSYPLTLHHLTCSFIAEEQGEMQREGDFSVARNADKLVWQAGVSGARRTIQRLGARRLATCNVPVVFEAPMAQSLIGDFIDAISGRNLYNRTSFLVDHLGKPIFPAYLTINECPHLPQALASCPFDAEGVKTSERILVNRGVLQGYILNSYAARKLKMSTTANAGGIHNLLVNCEKKYNLSQLLKLMKKGLLVTELLGQGVNLTTGDYSRGAFGFWVENGEIQYPVHGITIAGNLREMFAGIQAMASDTDTRSSIHTGSILVDHMTIAGS